MYIELCWPKEVYLYFAEDIKILENKLMFWFRFDKNHRNTTLSSFSKSLSLNFRFLLEQLSSKALKYLSLFLIQVEIVLGGTPYFLENSLLDRPFSMSLSALHFSFFIQSFLFNILKSTTPGSQRKSLKECLFLL